MAKKFKLKPVQQIIIGQSMAGLNKTTDIINRLVEDDFTYIYLEIKIQDGERQHDHRLIFKTKCKNINFAVKWYIYHYWGFSYRLDNAIYAWNGEISLKLSKYQKLTLKEYTTMYNIIYGI